MGITASLRVKSAFDIINLGESRTTSLPDLIVLLETALGKKASKKFLPEQPGDVPITYADIDHARMVLAYNPQTPIEAGIERFVQWFTGTIRD